MNGLELCGGNGVGVLVKSKADLPIPISPVKVFHDEADGCDYEKVLRRTDEIDQLTADFILALVNLDPENTDLSDLGIEIDDLAGIEDEIERILLDKGIPIDRPFIESEDGGDVYYENAFDREQGGGRPAA